MLLEFKVRLNILSFQFWLCLVERLLDQMSKSLSCWMGIVIVTRKCQTLSGGLAPSFSRFLSLSRMLCKLNTVHTMCWICMNFIHTPLHYPFSLIYSCNIHVNWLRVQNVACHRSWPKQINREFISYNNGAFSGLSKECLQFCFI